MLGVTTIKVTFNAPVTPKAIGLEPDNICSPIIILTNSNTMLEFAYMTILNPNILTCKVRIVQTL